MKISLFSDLHLEIGTWEPPSVFTESDIIILAGDIGSKTAGLTWAAATFSDKPVVYVCGNHELYDSDLTLLEKMRKPEWEKSAIHFLENRAIEIKGGPIAGMHPLERIRFVWCQPWRQGHGSGETVDQ